MTTVGSIVPVADEPVVEGGVPAGAVAAAVAAEVSTTSPAMRSEL